jgi:hypothetical protein
MLKGKLVGLTAVEREDLEQLRDWRNIPEFRKNFREYRELNMAMQERWFETEVINNPHVLMFSIKKLEDMELIGACGLCYINWVHRHADLSIYIGYKNLYIDKDYAPDAVRVLLNYAFNELNLNKVWTEIYEFDERKNELYSTFGFHKDAIFREQYFYHGRYWDSFIFSILAKEWKELGASAD